MTDARAPTSLSSRETHCPRSSRTQPAPEGEVWIVTSPATELRSRRAILAAAAGATLAAVASALGRPEPAKADGEAILVGGTYSDATTATVLKNSTNTMPVLHVESGGAGTAIIARSDTGEAVYAEASNEHSTAVHAFSQQGIAVGADSETGTGLWARSLYGRAVDAVNTSAGGPAIVGTSLSETTAVAGYVLGLQDAPPATPARTGVFGYADGASAHGVLGHTSSGEAVRGEAVSGTGVHARSTSGNALVVEGKATFTRSGRAAVASGNSSVDVVVPGGLGGTPLGFANLITYRSGTFVTAVRLNYPSSGRVRIYLNKSVTGTTFVAWLVLD
ncbi:MAG: hypothetical protein L3K06_01195 [Thermoplasmata archaeon]|nr:hypothetical protein [Thermoplasmata archaeon]